MVDRAIADATEDPQLVSVLDGDCTIGDAVAIQVVHGDMRGRIRKPDRQREI